MNAASAWRMFLVIALVTGFLLVVAVTANETVRQKILCSATGSIELARERAPGLVAAAPWSVGELTRALSEEERIGWMRTPRYTDTGHKIVTLPPELRRKLLHFHLSSAPQPEEGNAHLQGRIVLAMLAHTELEDELRAFLEAQLLSWTGLSELSFVNSYGPRTYTRGATLAMHGDRIHTHAVSAIVFVQATGLNEPWPLQFVPNGAAPDDRARNVFLNADFDVLLYESTQPHGRVTPLEGGTFSAVFFHWKPAAWSDHVEALLGPET